MKGDAEAVDETVDQDVVADEKGGLHRAGRNLKGLDEERPDEEREDNGDREGMRIFAENLHPGFRGRLVSPGRGAVFRSFLGGIVVVGFHMRT